VETNTKAKLLIVDDDEEIRTQMRWALTEDYDVRLAGDRTSAVEAFRATRPRVVLLDLGLPPQPSAPDEGLATLAALLEIDRTVKVVIISGQGEKANALNAIGAGAYDFLVKPVEMQELKLVLKRCCYVAQLEKEYREMQEELSGSSFEGLLGSGPRMQRIFDTVRKVATSEAPVLILGESGTGKEMTARAIHRCSNRREGAFVAINCSAIPETLIESELFGHERGAFTGAHAQRKGRIETAAAGTLFLDEIGEVPLPIQVKLLRFLQEQTIERVGGRQEIKVDTRIVTATNADLAKGMQEGTFREDLFYRLAVVQITLPPLRERNDDAVVLAKAFLQRCASESGKSGLSFAPEALRAIREHAWPGNVRELQNRVKRAAIMTEDKRISAADLELSHVLNPTAAPTSLREAREQVERELVTKALRRCGGNVSNAAAELGISRPAFYELLAKLGVEQFR
jgi:two-component system NtrC family response regulator